MTLLLFVAFVKQHVAYFAGWSIFVYFYRFTLLWMTCDG
jgi:hypothetical protein